MSVTVVHTPSADSQHKCYKPSPLRHETREYRRGTVICCDVCGKHWRVRRDFAYGFTTDRNKWYRTLVGPLKARRFRRASEEVS